MLRVTGPENTQGEELIIKVAPAKTWKLLSLAGVMDGTDTLNRRTLILTLLSSEDAGNDLFRDVLFDEGGPMGDILFCSAVGMARRRDNVGNPYILNPLPALSLPAEAVVRLDSGGAGLHEIFLIVEET